MEPKQQIEQLTRELEHAGYLYYVLDNPEMSDYDYDHKLRQLEELEAQYPQYASPLSPTRRVGGQALSEFVKVRHSVPLESLQDVFSEEEVEEFDRRLRETVRRIVWDMVSELARSDFRPLAFELEFDCLTQSRPDAPQLQLRGKIDRVDG